MKIHTLDRLTIEFYLIFIMQSVSLLLLLLPLPHSLFPFPESTFLAFTHQHHHHRRLLNFSEQRSPVTDYLEDMDAS